MFVYFVCLLFADAVSGADLKRVGERLMESNPSMAVIGDLKDVPSRREVEAALFENNAVLTKKKSKFFSFNA